MTGGMYTDVLFEEWDVKQGLMLEGLGVFQQFIPALLILGRFLPIFALLKRVYKSDFWHICHPT